MKQRIITGICAFCALLLMVWLGEWALFCNRTDCPLRLFVRIYLYGIQGSFYVESYSDALSRYCHDFLCSLVPGLCGTFDDCGDFVAVCEDILSSKHDTQGTIFLVWGWFYISYILTLSIKILFSSNGVFLFVMTVLACIACDTLAYFVGIKFGRHKLCPDISPKNQWREALPASLGLFLWGAAQSGCRV
jgi:CDP-diglyceride synthetase